jgi:esterase FrsA
MSAPSEKNLSETLFNKVQSFKIRETSTISNSGDPLSCEPQEQFLIDGLCTPSWFRVLRRAFWIWQGAEPIEVEEMLARIATSDGERTNPQQIDTVQGFVPGNWSYEWSQLAGDHNRKAKTADEAGEHWIAKKEYFLAARYYSIASYPHLKGDELAEQAQVQANMAYRDGGRYLPVPLKELKVPFRGKEIKGYLHLPHDDHPVPLVMVTGGIDSLQLDFIRLYEKMLAPLGIGMLSLDLPGCGYSSHWPLVEDSSRLHQAVLQYLKDVPWVDDQRIGMIGFRLGGNVAVRLSYLEQLRMKAVVCIGPGMHNYFTDPTQFALSPPMMRASLANRLNMDASNWDALQKSCQVFSLKRQGLAGVSKTRVPILSIGHRRDFICPEADIRMLASSSLSGKALVLDKEPVKEQMNRMLSEIGEWLRLHFNL